jgi:N utilization substance protein B
MGQRRRSREFALQVLYQIDLTREPVSEALQRFWSGRDVDDTVRLRTERLVRGVLGERDAIDERIAGAARRWRLERMPVVDRNVLRLAVHELLSSDTPPAVVIDEAIEVARRFGGGESGAFINGILDAIRRSVEDDSSAAGG